MLKKFNLFLLAFGLSTLTMLARTEEPDRVSLPTPAIAAKTNILYDATTTINVEMDVKTGRKATLCLLPSESIRRRQNQRHRSALSTAWLADLNLTDPDEDEKLQY